MKANKKKLAEIFEIDVRTITTWQSQGLMPLSGGDAISGFLVMRFYVWGHGGMIIIKKHYPKYEKRF